MINIADDRLHKRLDTSKACYVSVVPGTRRAVTDAQAALPCAIAALGQRVAVHVQPSLLLEKLKMDNTSCEKSLTIKRRIFLRGIAAALPFGYAVSLSMAQTARDAIRQTNESQQAGLIIRQKQPENQPFSDIRRVREWSMQQLPLFTGASR